MKLAIIVVLVILALGCGGTGIYVLFRSGGDQAGNIELGPFKGAFKGAGAGLLLAAVAFGAIAIYAMTNSSKEPSAATTDNSRQVTQSSNGFVQQNTAPTVNINTGVGDPTAQSSSNSPITIAGPVIAASGNVTIGVGEDQFNEVVGLMTSRIQELEGRLGEEVLARAREILAHARTYHESNPEDWVGAAERVARVLELDFDDNELALLVRGMHGSALATAGVSINDAKADLEYVIQNSADQDLVYWMAVVNRAVVLCEANPPEIALAIQEYSRAIESGVLWPNIQARTLVNRAIAIEAMSPDDRDRIRQDCMTALDIDGISEAQACRAATVLLKHTDISQMESVFKWIPGFMNLIESEKLPSGSRMFLAKWVAGVVVLLDLDPIYGMAAAETVIELSQDKCADELEACAQLGIIWMKLGIVNKAEEYLRRSLEGDCSASIMKIRGKLYLAKLLSGKGTDGFEESYGLFEELANEPSADAATRSTAVLGMGTIEAVSVEHSAEQAVAHLSQGIAGAAPEEEKVFGYFYRALAAGRIGSINRERVLQDCARVVESPLAPEGMKQSAREIIEAINAGKYGN